VSEFEKGVLQSLEMCPSMGPRVSPELTGKVAVQLEYVFALRLAIEGDGLQLVWTHGAMT